MIWETLYGIASRNDVHKRYAWNLTNSAAQFTVARGNDIALVCSNALDQAVVSVRSRVAAIEALEPRITCDAKSHAVAMTQFLKLRDNTVSHTWYALRKEAIHHPTDKLQLVL